jgi:Family of unknown function (DUF6085)
MTAPPPGHLISDADWQAALEAGAVALHQPDHDAGCPRHEHEDRLEGCRTIAEDVLGAAMPVIWRIAAASERERIYDQLGHDHYVIFTADGWTTEHSIECRLSGHMHECEIHRALSGLLRADAFPGRWLGRWRVTGIASDGVPELERAEPSP